MTGRARLAWLYVRSRRLPWLLAGLGVLLVLVGLSRWATQWPASVHDSISVFAATLAAVLLVGGCDTAADELDYTAALRWYRWRAVHLFAGLPVTIVPLALVTHPHATVLDLIMVRDVFGFTGLAALTAVLTGAALCWIAPLGYALIVWILPVAPLTGAQFWLWPVLTPDVAASWLVALVLFAAGSTLLTIRGVPLRLTDPAV